MLIIEAISDMNIGGAGILLLNRLSCLKAKEHKTVVLLPKGSRLAALFADKGIDTEEVDIEGDRSFDLMAIPKICKAIRRYSPFIVNCHGFLSVRVAAMICRVPRRFCTRHCFYEISGIFEKRYVKKLSMLANGLLTHRFIAVSHSAADNLRSMGIDASSINVIINGSRTLITLPQEKKNALKNTLGISEDAVVVGIFARLEACKGHDVFLRASAILQRRGVNAFFLIVGDGSLGDKLKEMSKDLGVEKKVFFTGFLDDITEMMNIVDINVNCSRGTETSSLALSEGMGLGKPAIVSNYGGNPYMVKDGINGLIYQVDDADMLAKKIESLVNDKQLYSRLAEGARKRFESEFKAEYMTEKTYRLYEEIESV